MRGQLRVVPAPELNFTIEIIPKSEGYVAIVYHAGLEWHRTIIYADRRHGERSHEAKGVVLDLAMHWIRHNHPDAVVSTDDIR